jgi:hypothetical protein
MIKITLKIAIVFSSALILGMLGMLVGAYIGGNFATNFQLIGVRGYEATGQVGFILGAALGIVISWMRLKNR